MPTISQKSKGVEYLKEKRIGLTPEHKGDVRSLISKWLKVSERGISHTQEPERGKRNLERIKKFFHKQFVPTVETFPIDEYRRVQNQAATDLGYGNLTNRFTDEQIKENVNVEIENIKESLDKWIEYFSSKDSNAFPIWAKYWAFMGITRMSGKAKINKDTDEISFPKREKNTISVFPELNQEALALAIQHIVNLVEKGEKLDETLIKESFTEVYTFYLNKLRNDTTLKELEITEGEWVKFNRGEDIDVVDKLITSLEGKNTGWCTAGRFTAMQQLRKGDFYIYYSKSSTDKPNPRIAIRMEGNNIREIRGIARFEEMDDVILQTNILEKKLKDFGPEEGIYLQIKTNLNVLLSIISKLKSDSTYQLNEEEEDLIKKGAQGFGNTEEDPRALKIKILLKLREKINIDNLNEDDFNRLTQEDFVNIAQIIEFISPKLHTKIANELIIVGKGEYVAKNLNNFVNLNHIDIANQLFDTGKGAFVAYNIYKFRTLDQNIAMKLIGEGNGFAVANNLSKFKGINHVEIANKLIEKRGGAAVAENLSKFKGINHIEVSNKLIETGFGEAVANNLDKFVGLNHLEVVDKLFSKGYGGAIAGNIEKFKEVSPVEIANKLIETGFGEAVANNLDKFKGLNHKEVVDKLFSKGYGAVIAGNIEKLKEIDHVEIARRLFDEGKGEIVAYRIDKFIGLNHPEIANRLIDEGKGRHVAYNLEKFSNLDHSIIAIRLIETQNSRAIIDNLEKFNKLNQETVKNLISIYPDYLEELRKYLK